MGGFVVLLPLQEILNRGWAQMDADGGKSSGQDQQDRQDGEKIAIGTAWESGSDGIGLLEEKRQRPFE
jgi:hypothetical protein